MQFRIVVASVTLVAPVASPEGLGHELYKAAMPSDAESVLQVLPQGADIESKAPDGLTALVLAAQAGFTESVQVLFEGAGATR